MARSAVIFRIMGKSRPSCSAWSRARGLRSMCLQTAAQRLTIAYQTDHGLGASGTHASIEYLLTQSENAGVALPIKKTAKVGSGPHVVSMPRQHVRGRCGCHTSVLGAGATNPGVAAASSQLPNKHAGRRKELPERHRSPYSLRAPSIEPQRRVGKHFFLSRGDTPRSIYGGGRHFGGD